MADSERAWHFAGPLVAWTLLFGLMGGGFAQPAFAVAADEGDPAMAPIFMGTDAVITGGFLEAGSALEMVQGTYSSATGAVAVDAENGTVETWAMAQAGPGPRNETWSALATARGALGVEVQIQRRCAAQDSLPAHVLLSYTIGGFAHNNPHIIFDPNPTHGAAGHRVNFERVGQAPITVGGRVHTFSHHSMDQRENVSAAVVGLAEGQENWRVHFEALASAHVLSSESTDPDFGPGHAAQALYAPETPISTNPGYGFALAAIGVDWRDTQPPALSIEPEAASSYDSWIAAPLTVWVRATDKESCTETLEAFVDGAKAGAVAPGFNEEPTAVVLEETGRVEVRAEAVDYQGNRINQTREFMVDASPPLSNARVSCEQNAQGDCMDNATVRFECLDAESGCLAEQLWSRVDEGPWSQGAALEVAGYGRHLVEYFAEDLVGNAEPQSHALYVDVACAGVLPPVPVLETCLPL